MRKARLWLPLFLAGVACHGAPPAPPAAPASALVKTAALQKSTLSDSLTAFGDVATGQVVAISFPRAGQVSRLLVVPGQRVGRGTALLELTSDPTARLAYTQAESAVSFSAGELRRNEELLSLQLATLSQVDAAKKALHDAEANLAAQRQLGGDVGHVTVTAPFPGVVTSVAVAQGDRIQPGAAVLQLGHADVLRVRLGVEPNDAPLVRVGMPVTLSLVDDFKRSVATTVAENQGLVDPKTQLVDAVVEVPASAAGFLLPGRHVRAEINVGQRTAWAVPRAAVLNDARGAYIFQVSSGKAHRADVTAAAAGGGLIAISGAVDPTLPVVILGNYELQDGMSVRVTP
ncbi:MAG: Cobalt/zinc/cadmium efflux transporter [Acidobacteria bacterium]|nr:Cobalt/zinc/cadmium efflux transporter [Acidobacteriota bacterium]